MVAAIAVVPVLGLLLVGLLQARADTLEPALLRYKAWQLLLGLLLLIVASARAMSGGGLPHPTGTILGAAPVLLLSLLALVLLLRKRRAAAADIDF